LKGAPEEHLSEALACLPIRVRQKYSLVLAKVNAPASSLAQRERIRGGYGKTQSVLIISGLPAAACIRSHALAPNPHPGSSPVSSPGSKYEETVVVYMHVLCQSPYQMTVVAQAGLTEAARMRP
jgi:hypothetical protein